MNILVGFIGIIIGFLLVWKADWIYRNFGSIDWAEQHLGNEGGTRLMWKLVGLIIIFVSLLIMFGMMGGIITGIFGNLYRK
jgi:hypothetical protein